MSSCPSQTAFTHFGDFWHCSSLELFGDSLSKPFVFPRPFVHAVYDYEEALGWRLGWAVPMTCAISTVYDRLNKPSKSKGRKLWAVIEQG